MAPRPETSHYFSRHAPAGFHISYGWLTWHGKARPWATGPGVFSREHLDLGSELLLESIEMRTGERLLDLGCGSGAVGVLIHERFGDIVSVLSDVAHAALACARLNAGAIPEGRALVVAASGYESFREASFDVIALNPPIRAGRAVVAPMLSQAPRYLSQGGRFYMVARVAQGAATLERIVAQAFGAPPELVARKSGYRVSRAVRPATGGAPCPASRP